MTPTPEQKPNSSARVLVCGGRRYSDRAKVGFILDSLCANRGWGTQPDEHGNWLPTITVIHGGCEGADSLVNDWAICAWCPVEVFKADWKTHGKAAGPIRNRQMIVEGKPDLVVAFPGGRGTANMIEQASKAGIEVLVIGGEL